MEINLCDIEDVIVCKCGIVYQADIICNVKEDEYSNIKTGKCKVCGNKLSYYEDE